MRIRVDDIPAAGRELDFELDRGELNERVELSRSNDREAGGLEPPHYSFQSNPQVHLRLTLEGSTVVLSGTVEGSYRTVCSRCADETTQKIEAPLDIVLKPLAARTAESEDAEDLHFGYYENEEILCDVVAEEFLVLALPFTVLCSSGCKGLCPTCGKNLNEGLCACPPEQRGDPRLQVLRDLKLQ